MTAILLRPAEVAELLSCSRSRVYELCQRGELPGAVRLAGTVRVHRPTLESWLAALAADGRTNPPKGAA